VTSPETEATRRRVELARGEVPPISTCEIHGEHSGLVCIPCYDAQVVRVERESLPLRVANTSEALRASVVAHLGTRNGHADADGWPASASLPEDPWPMPQ
jgi:hypothetical protein